MQQVKIKGLLSRLLNFISFKACEKKWKNNFKKTRKEKSVEFTL